jgi:PST family polysaccharide transporter
MALRLISVVILARMLTPEHFGLITMVTALTMFVERFQDLGMGDAIIQRKDITHEQVSTLFWINFLVCISFTIILSSLSGVVAWFYNDKRLIWITIGLSCNFSLAGLAIEHQALIRRQMRFSVFGWNLVLSFAFGFIVAIILAWKGFGYWALVWKEIARNIFYTAGNWLFCSWRPGKPVRNSGTKALLKFGGNVTGFNILNFLSTNLDSILIGRFCGAIPLGLYSRAQQLITIPATQLQFPINYVSLPALSSLQNEPERYKKYYEKMLGILTFLYMPMIVYISICAKPVVLLVLGAKWLSAVPFFRLLAFSVFVIPINQTLGSVMISTGNTKRYFKWGIFIAVCLIISFSIGIHWGPIGVATAYPFATWTILLISLFWVFIGTPLHVSSIFKTIWQPVTASIAMGGTLFFLLPNLAGFNNVLTIGVTLGCSIVIYLIVWTILPGGKNKMSAYLSYPMIALKFKKVKA